MSLARRLQVRAVMSVVVLARPPGIDLEVPSECLVTSEAADAPDADAVVAFVVRATDLDVLAALVLERGAQPVRQVAVDGVWTGLRLRPA